MMRVIRRLRVLGHRDCAYYTHYLRSGPPDLSHAVYHEMVDSCLGAQEGAVQSLALTLSFGSPLWQMAHLLEGTIRLSSPATSTPSWGGRKGMR